MHAYLQRVVDEVVPWVAGRYGTSQVGSGRLGQKAGQHAAGGMQAQIVHPRTQICWHSCWRAHSSAHTCTHPPARSLTRLLAHSLTLRPPHTQEARHLCFGGSSFGGICALSMVLDHPGAFGSLLVESPSLWLAGRVGDWVGGGGEHGV